MKTKFFSKNEVKKKWWLVNADGLIVGRLAARVAAVLLGKTKPVFTPGSDCGDNVVIINASKLRVTGNKLEAKTKFSWSGYPQGDKYEKYGDLMQKNPAKLLTLAVRGMLPKNRIGDRLIKNLKIYNDDKHLAGSHKPEQLDIMGRR